MSYHAKTKALVKDAPSSLGVRLGRLAIKHNFSVQEIAKTTGATRATVYSWISGKSEVTNSYRVAVKALILKIQNT